MSSDVASRLTRKQDVRTKKRLDGKGQFWLVFRYVALTILFVIAALPIYIMVINSVKGITGVTQSAAFTPPTSLNFEAWGPTWKVLREPMARTLFFVVQSSIISDELALKMDGAKAYDRYSTIIAKGSSDE